jgi:hypothetical protein
MIDQPKKTLAEANSPTFLPFFLFNESENYKMIESCDPSIAAW